MEVLDVGFLTKLNHEQLKDVFQSCVTRILDMDESSFDAVPLSYLEYPCIKTHDRYSLKTYHELLSFDNGVIEIVIKESYFTFYVRKSSMIVPYINVDIGKVDEKDEEYENIRKSLVTKRKAIINFYQDCLNRCLKNLK